MTRLVLASQSPRRADILRQLGLDPEIEPAHVDETMLEGEAPAAYVERLARKKAEAVAAGRPEALVVGGDTVVVDGADVLSKPESEEHAVNMLTRLSGRAHDVLSGIAVTVDGETYSSVVRTTVRMRRFDVRMARAYVETGEPMDKAGSYGIQGIGASLVESIEGDYYAVVGFPVGGFIDLLARAGWRFDVHTLRRSDD